MSVFGFLFGRGKRRRPGDRPKSATRPSALAGQTYYDILGVSTIAAADQIKAAYRRRAFDTHPDRHPDDPLATARFIRVQQAYDVLSDPDRRAAYDLQQSTLARAGAYWKPTTITITLSYSYYGYEVPLETMERAEKEANRLAAESGIGVSEAMARFLLDPLIAQTRREIGQRPSDVALHVRLADLCFHTYRSFEALECYARAFDLSPTWQTAADSEHLAPAFSYAGDYWGGVKQLGRLLTMFPGAPGEVRQRWAEAGIRLLSSAEREATKDAPPDRKLEMMLSILQKKMEFGHRPRYRDHKAIADVATAAGVSTVAQEHLAAARGFHLEHNELASLIRAHVRQSLLAEAIALGERLLTPEHLQKTLTASEKSACRALAEAYEQAGRDADALWLYTKLSRYRDASESVKRKVQRLKARCVSGHERVQAARPQVRLPADLLAPGGTPSQDPNEGA